MRFFLCILCAVALQVCAGEVIAMDSTGLLVEVKEKYGSLLYDTCTVVMLCGDSFVLVRKDGRTSWFPTSFHSVRVFGRLNGQER